MDRQFKNNNIYKSNVFDFTIDNIVNVDNFNITSYKRNHNLFHKNRYDVLRFDNENIFVCEQ